MTIELSCVPFSVSASAFFFGSNLLISYNGLGSHFVIAPNRNVDPQTIISHPCGIHHISTSEVLPSGAENLIEFGHRRLSDLDSQIILSSYFRIIGTYLVDFFLSFAILISKDLIC